MVPEGVIPVSVAAVNSMQADGDGGCDGDGDGDGDCGSDGDGDGDGNGDGGGDGCGDGDGDGDDDGAAPTVRGLQSGGIRLQYSEIGGHLDWAFGHHEDWPEWAAAI